MTRVGCHHRWTCGRRKYYSHSPFSHQLILQTWSPQTRLIWWVEVIEGFFTIQVSFGIPWAAKCFRHGHMAMCQWETQWKVNECGKMEIPSGEKQKKKMATNNRLDINPLQLVRNQNLAIIFIEIWSDTGCCEYRRNPLNRLYSLTGPRISASAAGVRGLIIHLNWTGHLSSRCYFVKMLVCIYICDHAYDKNPLVKSGFSSMVLPWSSTGGLMS